MQGGESDSESIVSLIFLLVGRPRLTILVQVRREPVAEDDESEAASGDEEVCSPYYPRQGLGNLI